MKKIFIILLFFLIPINSYTQNFNPKKLNIDISIKKNGDIKIREEFFIPQGDSAGIIKNIPVYFNDLKGIRRKIFISHIKVSNGNYTIERTNNFYVIKISPANRETIKEKRIELSYTLYGLISEDRDYDLFYHTFTNSDWNFFEKIEFFIFLPENHLAKEQDIIILKNGTQIYKDTKIKVEKGFINGIIEKSVDKNFNIMFIITLPRNLITVSESKKIFYYLKEAKVILIPMIVLLFLFLLWWIIGKDEVITKVVYYKPPQNLNPAIAGFLFNDKADNRDLLSLLFYWAKEGIISIEEVEDPTSLIIRKKDYILRQLKPLPLTSKPFEWTIFNGLFPYNIRSVRVSSLKNNFHSIIDLARKELAEYVENLNLYSFPSLIMRKALLTLFAPTLIIGILLGYIGKVEISISFIISSFILLLFEKIMPKKNIKGQELYKNLIGFKNFLEKVEKPKIQKILSKKPDYLNEILPYAIAFGMVDKLVDKFEGLFSKPNNMLIKNKNPINNYDFLNEVNELIYNLTKIFITFSKN